MEKNEMICTWGLRRVSSPLSTNTLVKGARHRCGRLGHFHGVGSWFHGHCSPFPGL